MSRVVSILVALVLFSTSLQARQQATGPAVSVNAPGPLHLYFSPRAGATDAIALALGEARETVLIQACSFTSQLLEDGGIEAFVRREALPYTPDAWIKEDYAKTGFEISFTRHFYKARPLRTLEEISADILAIEREAEGLMDGLLKGVTK